MIIIFTTCTNEIKKSISNYKEINNFKEARVVALVAGKYTRCIINLRYDLTGQHQTNPNRNKVSLKYKNFSC